MNKENKIKPKKKCPRCNKVKRKKCFVYNKLLKIEVCKMCNRSVGNNKFYIPFQERKNNRKISCSKCGKKVMKLKYLKRLNGGLFCSKCVKEKRKEHREFLKRKVMGIRKKEDIMKECKRKKEREKILRKIVSQKPNIKSINSNRPKISSLGIYLTKNEKLVLYKKLIKKGLDYKTINGRIKNVCNQMKIVMEKLRETVKTKEELNKRFKEEFVRLVEKENLK